MQKTGLIKWVTLLSLLLQSKSWQNKAYIQKVPQQYLLPNQDPIVVSNTTSLTQLPIINFDKLLREGDAEIEKLDKACKEWGFFQLINHGVEPSLVESMKIGVQEFFNLPMEEKKKFCQTEEEMQGFGQVFVALEEGKLRWGDMFFIKTFPLYIRLPHLFPCIPQPFRDNLENYSLQLRKLCFTIINFMAKALKIQKQSEMLDFFKEGDQVIRLNYYPPSSGDNGNGIGNCQNCFVAAVFAIADLYLKPFPPCPQPDQVIGLNPHSDASALTILLQVNEMQGLQVKKDGLWIPINPLPNAFVVNVGDQLEIMTNGIYKSIEHRATVNSEKERISVAAFHNFTWADI
ncbi:protein SRG1 [Trifolium repens]|nr:protein SRG1 [Trifolium repens]